MCFKTKLVIIIDDLDRCEPEVAFAIFEAMKLYLNFDNCIFLLSIDQKAIERIIQLKYEKENTKATSKLYLEKIVQDVFHIPLLDREQKVKYFKKLAEDLGSLNQLVYNEVLKHLEAYDFLPPIPRSIKIFVNSLFALLESKNELGNEKQGTITEQDICSLIVVTYLYAYHSEIYTALFYYEDFLGTLTKFCANREELLGINNNEVMETELMI